MSTGILAVYALLSVGGLTCFKIGAQQGLSVSLSGTTLSLQIRWLSIVGLAMYVLSFLIYMGLVSKSQLSYLMPVSTAAVYTLTMLVSVLIFHETFSILKAVGVLFVLLGVILMNVDK